MRAASTRFPERRFGVWRFHNGISMADSQNGGSKFQQPKEMSMELRLLLALVLTIPILFIGPYFFGSQPPPKKAVTPATAPAAVTQTANPAAAQETAKPAAAVATSKASAKPVS